MNPISFKEELMSEFEYAITNEIQLFAVRIHFEDTDCYETIINTKENFIHKLNYYDKTYTDDLVHKRASEIKIIDFVSAETYADIETAFDF